MTTESVRLWSQHAVTIAGITVSAFNLLEPIIGKTYAITLRQWSRRPTLPGKGTASSSDSSQPSDTSDGEEIVRGTSEGVADALDKLGIEIRCNVRTMNSEFRVIGDKLRKRLGDPPSSEWIEDSDDLQSVLRVATESNLSFSNGKKTTHAYFSVVKWEDGMRYARSLNMVDPFWLWLKSLPCLGWKVQAVGYSSYHLDTQIPGGSGVFWMGSG